ncbi:MAG: acpS [Clostridia bacterium]|jgi:holo-[acyl-carrier-protein] synthase|nr:acpS [Clostridia bacterium]
MIFGIGTDIIEIDRLKKAIKRNPKILNRLFTDYEIEYFKSRSMNVQHIAGSFSAKEAVVKSLGTGISGFCWKDVELLRGSSGKPMVKLYNNAKKLAAKNKIGIIFISISHSQSHAMATAVAELLPSADVEARNELAFELQEENMRKIN